MTATEVVNKMVAKINRHVGVSTIIEKPRALDVLRTDWEYLTKVAAGVQGESWYHITNSCGRTGR